MLKSFKKIAIFLFILFFAFVIGNTILAQVNTGIDTASGIGLGDTDPRIMVANVIRIFLGFLGLIALILILYAGILWTTSAGDSTKIDKAKKILVSAVIGLLIILSAFAIASFILSRLLGTTNGAIGGPGGGGGGIGGGGGGGVPVSCDGNTLTPACEADNTLCSSGTEYCETTSCSCQPLAGFGEACDSDTTNAPTCDPDDSMCVSGLSCDGTSCLCEGAPIIDWVSPVDNLDTPNGAIGDFVSIGGRFFGTTTGTVIFGGTDTDGDGNEFGDADDRIAIFPNSVNANCTNNWTDGQVIVVVPVGALDGPIRLIRQIDSEEDSTNNSRGASIDDFLINTTNRPGLCLANPASGYFEDTFDLQGVSFTGALQRVSFGNNISSTSAININTWNNTSVNAAVPNIGGGVNTVFVTVDGVSSNALNFNVYIDLNNTPIIDYIDPSPAPPGQYTTIFGNNFGNSYSAPAKVLFTNQTSGDTYTADGLDFPLECQDSWWQNNYILIKIPPQIADDGNFGLYNVVVTNNGGFSSLPEVLDVNNTSPGPGICEMIPHNGPVGFNVEIIGDNFTTLGTASFFDGINVPSFSSWTNQSIETLVPAGAQTGPVRVTTLAPSNPFPFMVGDCASDSECGGGEECCSSGTYWDGICRNTGTCNDSNTINTTGYGWTFSSVGLATNIATSTETCSGWSGGNACLIDGNDCPNSPGECQTNPAPVTGVCGDAYCDNLSACGVGNCEYDNTVGSPTYNRCIAVSAGAYQDTCDQTNSLTFGTDTYEASCAQVTTVDGQVNAWQIQANGSCPAGTYQDTNGWCTVIDGPGGLGTGTIFDGPLQCNLCDAGFSCVSNQCVAGGSICDSESTCNDSGECIGEATCECCCEVNPPSGVSDCCLGLTCDPGPPGTASCGSFVDNNSDTYSDYGQCTGCRVEDGADNTTVNASEQSASDLACNCTGTTGKFCFIDPTAPAGDPLLSGVCLDAVVPTGGGLGDPCDMDTTNATCDPDATMCLGDYVCDPTDCTCQEEITMPGAQCIQDVTIGLSTVFTCNPSFACGTGYSCLDDSNISNPIEDCGTCCCVPGTLLVTTDGSNLTCQADKGPCSGADRGLYCGCESDLECGDGSVAACGEDTCCRPRPQVTNTSPPDEPTTGSDSVCRNVLLEATFDTEMDVSTFRGNMILLGDYGNNPCPEGTQYLSLDSNSDEQKNKNIFVKESGGIKDKILSFIFDQANAYQAVTATNNFCAIRGKTDGYNNTSGQGVLTFSPNRALDGNTRYYAIVVGDNVLDDDNPGGVLDQFGISMGVNSTFTETFNSKLYENSYVWSFITMSDQGENQGLCTVDYIDIDPASYLFQTTENSLLENDINPNDNSYDTEKDSDKEFVATAKTISGQGLNPVAGLYTWVWSWMIDNPGIADFVTLGGLADNKRLIRAQSSATEGKTKARATASISGSLIPGGDIKTGVADIYLFLCNNPWPSVDSAGLWAPWRDQDNNCTVLPEGAGTCANTNYEFYYCRDQGTESTFDDLPPILDDAVIRGRDTDQNLFKEYYFFREKTPDLSTINLDLASVPAEGNSVNVWWDNFTPDVGENLDKFLIYYGTNSGNYTDTMSIGPFVPHTLASPVTVSNLDNGQVYYFAITAVYESGAESSFSNEISTTPQDTQAPVATFISSTTIADSQVKIQWNEINDASSYKIYWKAGSGCATSNPPDCYANSENIGKVNEAVITDLTNGTAYYFAITAIDSSGNESAYSNEVFLIPDISSATDILETTSLAFENNKNTITEVSGGVEINKAGRINLFNNIVKYFFKKISFPFIDKVEAKGK